MNLLYVQFNYIGWCQHVTFIWIEKTKNKHHLSFSYSVKSNLLISINITRLNLLIITSSLLIMLVDINRLLLVE